MHNQERERKENKYMYKCRQKGEAKEKEQAEETRSEENTISRSTVPERCSIQIHHSSVHFQWNKLI